MSRYANALNISSTHPGERASARSSPALLAALLIGLAVAYILPWLTGPGAGLTFNGCDLAEWVSLYPAARAETPPLLTPLLLRLPLALAGLIAVVGLASPWLRALAAGVTALALMPPLDFFLGSSADPNYRQQFALTVGVLAGSVLLTRWPSRRAACAGLGALGFLALAAGLPRAHSIAALAGIQVALGPGGLLMAALFLALTARALLIKQTRQPHTTVSSQGI